MVNQLVTIRCGSGCFRLAAREQQIYWTGARFLVSNWDGDEAAYPTPPPGPIQVMLLAGNSILIHVAQSFAGKILSCMALFPLFGLAQAGPRRRRCAE